MLADAPVIVASALLAPALAQVGAGVGIAATVALGAGAFKWAKRLNRALDRVEHQVTPNGGQGNNLGDRARRTEEAVARMEGRLVNHEARLVTHTNQLHHNSEQLAHIEQQIASTPASAPSVTVNTTTTSPASQQARRTPLPPPPPGVNE